MSVAKYSAYKESGIPWIGSLPAHWESVPYKHLVDIQNGADHKHIEQAEGYPVIGSGGVFAYASEFMYEGDSVLLGRKGTVDKPLFVSGRFWTVDTMYWTKIAHDASPRFAYYVALTIPFDYYSTNTALPSMTKSVLHAHVIARPPPAEQVAIVAFLDKETAKIDDLVEEQRRLIDLLKEKRQAVISQAVAKGLNPNVLMKDSEVEWLGSVPAHWSVSQLRRLLSGDVANGIFKKKDEFGSGVLLVNVYDAYRRDFCVEFSSLDRVNCTSAELDAYQVQLGDLLFVRSSLKQEGIAVVVLVGRHAEPAVFECHLIRARPNPVVLHPRYASYVFGSYIYRGQMISSAKMTTMTTIDQEAIKSIAMVTPPLSEQVDIAVYLDDRVSQLDQLIDQACTATNLLLERRAALISAAITGKIDVRGLVPQPEAVPA